ncbi:MAG: hypothetical protein KGK33_05730, partial [Hyphomicrobiales bacterium]|nr:hypothetical protein [Hyphomicrobiales bacterium]
MFRAARRPRLPSHEFVFALLEPIRKLLESDESDVIPYSALDSLGSARCGHLNTAGPRIAAAFV